MRRTRKNAAQSTMSVISGQTTVNISTSQSYHSPRHFAVFVWRGVGENRKGRNEWARGRPWQYLKYVMRQSGILTYSRHKKREPLIALGSDQPGLGEGRNFCVRSTPLRGSVLCFDPPLITES